MTDRSLLVTLDDRQRNMLHAMGIRTWDTPQPFQPPDQTLTRIPGPAPAPDTGAHVAPSPAAITPAPAATGTVTGPVTGPSSPLGVEALSWEALKQSVAQCQACSLCSTRKQAVFGTGSPGTSPDIPPKVKWLIVGEAPGEQEDLAGQPFVGPAGKLLDRMLAAAGLSRNSPDSGGVYIVNTLKCRPPANRNPSPLELARCAPYLQRQVELLQPDLILALGRFAAQSVLSHVPEIDKLPLGRLRGRLHDRFGTPVVVSYHPAYLLRNLQDKAKAWEDLVLAMHKT